MSVSDSSPSASSSSWKEETRREYNQIYSQGYFATWRILLPSKYKDLGMHFYVHQYICIIMHLLSWSGETLPFAPLLLGALAGVSLWDLGHIWMGASCRSRAQLTESVHKNKSSNNHFLWVIQRMQCYYMVNQISNYIQKLLSTPRKTASLVDLFYFLSQCEPFISTCM